MKYLSIILFACVNVAAFCQEESNVAKSAQATVLSAELQEDTDREIPKPAEKSGVNSVEIVASISFEKKTGGEALPFLAKADLGELQCNQSYYVIFELFNGSEEGFGSHLLIQGASVENLKSQPTS